MKKPIRRVAPLAVLVLIGIVIGLAWSEAAERGTARADQGTRKAAKASKVQRFGSVIGLRPEKKDYYLKLHAAVWPSVLKQIKKSNIRNYSIYMTELDGKLYLFSYFEYVGHDFKGDMAKMAKDPETQRWWKETDPCQVRLPGTPKGEQWKRIPEVFHTD
jgi:L-rhamnose mutarotase